MMVTTIVDVNDCGMRPETSWTPVVSDVERMRETEVEFVEAVDADVDVD